MGNILGSKPEAAMAAARVHLKELEGGGMVGVD